MSWVPFAMVRITLFLSGGILLAIYYPDLIPEQVSFYVLIILICVYLISVLILRPWRWVKTFNGFVGMFAIFFFGYLHLQNSTDSRQTNHLLNEKDTIVAYEAIVRSAPESKAKSWKLQVEIVRVKTNQWKSRAGSVMLYVSKKSMDQIPWLYGDRLLIKGAREAKGYLVKSQYHDEQLREVFEELKLRDRVKLFSRCIACNSLLEDVRKEEIADRLLADTRKYFSVFRRCPSCDRIYWEGSHYDNMKKSLEPLL